MRLLLTFILCGAVFAALLSITLDRVHAEDRPRAGPAPGPSSTYRLRADDEVEIAVHRPGTFEPQLVRRLQCPADGAVSCSPVGSIDLIGRTTTEIEEEVARRLRERSILNEPNVGCVVTRYAPRTVSVIGAVRATVQLPVHRDLRVLELLARVSGLDTASGDFSHVEIRRQGPDGRPFLFDVDVDEVFKRPDDERNVVVREGDVIRVAPIETAVTGFGDHVYVLGKVYQRGKVPLSRSGSRPLTLVKLIALCGDFTEFADRDSVRIISHTATGRRSQTIDFDDIIEGKRPDYVIQPDDVVFVPESFL